MAKIIQTCKSQGPKRSPKQGKKEEKKKPTVRAKLSASNPYQNKTFMSFEIANIKKHKEPRSRKRERERTPIGSDEPRALLFFRIWQNFLVSSIFKNLP